MRLTTTAPTPCHAAVTPPGDHCVLPKPTGEPARDAEWKAARTSTECRPLTLRNCDAKAIAASVAYRARDGLSTWATGSQRGFVRGRQAIDNIADVIFFDFSQAFPSANHANMRRGIDATAPPLGAQNYLHRLCRPTSATIRLRETTPISLRINAGVAHGCPLSGMVFVIVLDPYLRLLRRVLAPTGRVRGFADDVAALVADPRTQLPQTASIFRTAAAAAAGLQLKPRKCKVVPIGPEAFSDEC